MPQVLRLRSRTLPDLLDEIAARDPAREFIVGGTERLSYEETRARVRQVAKGLLKLGVKRGDKVALLMPNRPEWLLIDFAVTLLGATLVPISTWSRARELAYMLDHSDATTLVTVERFAGQDYLGMLADLGGPGSERLPNLRRVVVVGCADAPVRCADAPVRCADAPVRCADAPVRFDELLNSSSTVEDAEIDAAQRTGAAIGPPSAMQMVMDLGAREICNVYGLTECYGNCAVTDAHDPADKRLATVGTPLPGMEIRIVDRQTRRPSPPGEVGEILVRGHLTPGYYKDTERNAIAFDADRCLVTGDLGLIGDDGYRRFRGRIKALHKR